MPPSELRARPTLLGSCASAATGAEARFRIDRPITPCRSARIIALDAAAATTLAQIAGLPWGAARFFRAGDVVRTPGSEGDLTLNALDGAPSTLLRELVDADMALVLATSGEGIAAATVVGRACDARGLTTAGIVLAGGPDTERTVSALRPHARVLLVSSDEQDTVALLSALRV